MTAVFTRRNSGNAHSYVLNGEKVPGVTTVIGLLDKPALVNWAAEQSAGYAVENWGWLGEKPIVERVKLIQNARFATNKKAIGRGHKIHAMAEALQHGRPVDVPPEFVGDIEAVARLLDQWQVDPLATELPICNTTEMYAGTADVIATGKGLPLAVWDFKTGKAVYDEVALQLCAYAHCDVRLTEVEKAGPRGGKLKSDWVPEPMFPGVDQTVGYIVHVQDGQASLHPITLDKDIWKTFLALVDVWWLWTRRVSWAHKQEESFNPPVGEPIYAETSAIIAADQPPF
jgi:hypothetical protein